MSPTAQATRFLGRRGELLTVREFTASGSNAYGDATQTPDDDTVRGFVEPLGTPIIVRAPSGKQVQVDARVYVADGDQPDEPLDPEKPSILISKDGLEYTVARVSPDQNGVRTLFCESRR